MKRITIAALTTTLVLGACAGRDPVPVSEYKPTDSMLSCTDLGAEIQGNNQKMVALAEESAETNDRNVAIGAAGVLLFAPALLAIDAKDAARTENRAFEARNRYLAELAQDTGCEVPPPYTAAMAEEEVARTREDEATSGPKAGKEANLDQ